MQEALKEAKKAYLEREVPIGAVVVWREKIIGRGYNQVERLNDPTAHAEMIALTSAAAYLNNWRLNETQLYTTVEPCLMCLGAVLLSRISTVVYGTEDPKKGACGSCYSLSLPRLKIIKGILRENCEQLLKNFFQEIRQPG
jgi:tRNA(adenine34) deaminase